MKTGWWIGIALLATAPVAAQSGHGELRKGDQNYNKEQYEAAEENYRQSLESRNTAQGAYNLGNTVYQQGRYDEAVKHFEEAAALNKDETARAMAYHNLGNTYYNLEDYEKSVEAYKNALRLRPEDQETKKNLAQALRRIVQQEQQQQQQSEEQDKKNEGEKDEEQQQQQPPQEDQEQPPQDPSDNDGEESPPQEQPQPQDGDISKEEAKKQLEIARDQERETMERLRKQQGQGCDSDKDW